MATGRTRVQNFNFPTTGTYYNRFVGTSFRTTVDLSLKTTTDVIGNFPLPNGFRSTSFVSAFPSASGEKWLPFNPPILDKSVKNMGPSYTPTSTGLGMPALTLAEGNNMANQILASTNPNVPHISVPTFIGELKDLPSLVRDWGGDLLRKAAKGYISWRWAVAPMISDIRKMCSFVDAVNKRIRTLENLRTYRSIKTRCSLGSSSTTTNLADVYIESSFAIWKAKVVQTDMQRAWGSAQWKLKQDYVLPTDKGDLTTLARRLTFGITSEEGLATAWQLMPWSWFADWFLGIDDALASQSNTIPVTGGQTCVMRTWTRRLSYAPYPNSSLDAWCPFKGYYFVETKIKDRQVVTSLSTLSPSFLPLLDAGKWSILGSLVALRRK